MYNIIILPLIAGVVAQTFKFLIRANKQKFSLKNAFAYSGMPSGHSAIVTSLSVIIGLENGWTSPLFGFSFIFAVLIIRDALGLRRFIGRHGVIINKLVKDLEDDEVLEQDYPKLVEHIGHTVAQVLVGALVGAAVSLAGYYIL